MPRTINIGETAIVYTWGALIAIIVLILCIVAYFFQKEVTNAQLLGLIALLALSRLS